MRKNYKTPITNTISLACENVILSTSGSKSDINVGIGNGTEKGSNALGNKKNIWGKEDIWE